MYEPLLILALPLGFVLLIFVTFLLVALQSWIGEPLARLVVITVVLALLFGNGLRLLQRPRRERSP